MSFVLQWNDLESLQIAQNCALRRASCRTFAMQALNWLLRSVTQSESLHDLLWCFVAALEGVVATPDPKSGSESANKKKKKTKPDPSNAFELCEHPTSDIYIAGEAIRPLPEVFHNLLQTISDIMLVLPVGSSLQQVAMRCWAIKFKNSDHPFLHKSHVFSTISRILSRSEELDNSAILTANQSFCELEGSVEKIVDITTQCEIKASSRPAMLASLTDNSTETFWESGDEDRNKSKWISLSCGGEDDESTVFKNVCLHVDNGRDLGNKVSSVTFKIGKSLEELQVVKQIDVESRFAGWINCFLGYADFSIVKVELKGPDNSLRIRQVKALGGLKKEEVLDPVIKFGEPKRDVLCSIQQRNCETETLRVFRLITGQVFGKLLEESQAAEEDDDVKKETNEEESYLKEHVVGILFSRSKLTHLQKQVCSHIVQAIKKEASKFRDDWEVSLCSGIVSDDVSIAGDTYCFEMLSLVLALSGSSVGRSYLAQQFHLLKDLLALLHTGSGRIQRQVIALLRRVLPKVPPIEFAKILDISNLPPKEFDILSRSSGDKMLEFDVLKPGLLDVFLSCIAKSLTLQVKTKGKDGKNVQTVSLASSIHPRDNVGERWWLRGTMSKKIAEEIILLLKDMTSKQLSEDWATVTKSAIAENIINLTRLDEQQRSSSSECLKLPVLWLALASLCVLDQDHVEGLSSVEKWNNVPRPTCENHDDGETLAIIQCDNCGNLCGDCDRFLHLHRRTKEHQRQVFKEEEEAIKVDLHEGCGRTKLFWVMALADSMTLKAMVEFRDGGSNVLGTAGNCYLPKNIFCMKVNSLSF